MIAEIGVDLILSKTLSKLMFEQQRYLDVFKLGVGFLCRGYATLLERYSSLHEQLTVKIKAVLPFLPSLASAEHQDVPCESPSKNPTRGPHLVECAAAIAKSPPVVVSIIPIHWKLFVSLFFMCFYCVGLLACSLACLTFILIIYLYIYQEPTDIPSRKKLMRCVCARGWCVRRGSLL